MKILGRAMNEKSQSNGDNQTNTIFMRKEICYEKNTAITFLGTKYNKIWWLEVCSQSVHAVCTVCISYFPIHWPACRWP